MRCNDEVENYVLKKSQMWQSTFLKIVSFLEGTSFIIFGYEE